MAGIWFGRLALFMGALALSGCEDGVTLPGFLASTPTNSDAPEAATSVRLVERDVEAPGVFQVTESGLWDGRPSLGGVWVAYTDVTDPERVIIRNPANGKFVIGALFRRGRETPGPALQVSSDAAAALGLLAGSPAALNVTALRREEVPEAPVAAEPEATAVAESETEIEVRPLDDVTSTAIAAIDAAEARTAPAASAPPQAAAAVPTTAAPATVATHARPYLQIGIFSVEANATRAGNMLRTTGVVPTVKKEQSQGKDFWRVIVGPANTSNERDALLAKVRGLGFADAYFVRN